jgi:3-deoxy-D-manno-octulosonate 8-phosphate phosphatase (KDO 8-P phosphatase)
MKHAHSPSPAGVSALHWQYPLPLWLAAQHIQLFITDVDGVLTPSTIVWDGNQVEQKVFNVKDGFGLRRIRKFGVKTGIITGRTSTIVAHRAKELDFDFVYQAVPDKGIVLQQLLTELNITPAQVAYMGDDLPDLPILSAVGLAICPADAVEAVKAQCHWVTTATGGNAAMREAIELLFLAKQPT